jgi:hypothetical protein
MRMPARGVIVLATLVAVLSVAAMRGRLLRDPDAVLDVAPTAATASERTVVTKEDGAGQGWAVVLNPTTNTIAIERGNAGSWDMANSATALKAGTWYHVVGTYDGSTLRTYINGTLETTLASSRSLPVITSSLWLSTNNPGFQYGA